MPAANKIKYHRERCGFSQTELAERAGVSLRTVQRIESGQNIPRGYTLTVLAQALELEIHELTEDQEEQKLTKDDEKSKIQLMNLAVLTFIIVPFGNVLFPFLIWNRNKYLELVNTVGRRILNFQITWTLITTILLIITPFFQVFILKNKELPLIIIVLVLLYIYNIIVVFKSASSIRKGNYDILKTSLPLL